MKITIFSFDLWGFNKKIAQELETLGNDVTYIDTSEINYVYKSFGDKILNFFSKSILKKNKKKTYFDAKINELINNLDPQDCCLIVNPSFFKPEVLNLLRTKTKKFIAYNYDSLKRIPLPANYNQLFDKIYSFDLEDTKKNTFLNHLPNFNYQKKKVNLYPKNKAFIIISQSETREIILNKIANYFDSINIKNYQFIVHKPKLKKLNKNIKITNNHISLDEINLMMENSDILIDLVRPNQTGLSFRIFEAMGMHKKIITNNKTIVEYDFYNSNNILVLNDDLTNITPEFLNNKFEPLPDDLYQKYTLENWVRTVFYN